MKRIGAGGYLPGGSKGAINGPDEFDRSDRVSVRFDGHGIALNVKKDRLEFLD